MRFSYIGFSQWGHKADPPMTIHNDDFVRRMGNPQPQHAIPGLMTPADEAVFKAEHQRLQNEHDRIAKRTQSLQQEMTFVKHLMTQADKEVLKAEHQRLQNEYDSMAGQTQTLQQDMTTLKHFMGVRRTFYELQSEQSARALELMVEKGIPTEITLKIFGYVVEKYTPQVNSSTDPSWSPVMSILQNLLGVSDQQIARIVSDKSTVAHVRDPITDLDIILNSLDSIPLAVPMFEAFWKHTRLTLRKPALLTDPELQQGLLRGGAAQHLRHLCLVTAAKLRPSRWENVIDGIYGEDDFILPDVLTQTRTVFPKLQSLALMVTMKYEKYSNSSIGAHKEKLIWYSSLLRDHLPVGITPCLKFQVYTEATKDYKKFAFDPRPLNRSAQREQTLVYEILQHTAPN